MCKIDFIYEDLSNRDCALRGVCLEDISAQTMKEITLFGLKTLCNCNDEDE